MAPFFNADFKDDKSYPFIALTKGDVFPAIKFTREKHRADTAYFGPFTDSRAARTMIDVARRVVPLCSASCADWRQLKRRLEKSDPGAFLSSAGSIRPCFDCHVGLGPGACCGQVTPEEYALNVKRVARFLDGQHREFIDEMASEMAEAAAELDFERAARLKARIDTVSALTDRLGRPAGRRRRRPRGRIPAARPRRRPLPRRRRRVLPQRQDRRAGHDGRHRASPRRHHS